MDVCVCVCLSPQSPTSPSVVKVDAANGVGGASMRRVMEAVRGDLVTLQLYNDGNGTLNDKVGRQYLGISASEFKGHIINLQGRGSKWV